MDGPEQVNTLHVNMLLFHDFVYGWVTSRRDQVLGYFSYQVVRACCKERNKGKEGKKQYDYDPLYHLILVGNSYFR